MEKLENAKLSPPWIDYFNQLKVLFQEDPAVKVIYDEESESPKVKILVEGTDKAEALSKLLPSEKVFGNVTLTITVVPANVFNGSALALFKAAFDGNEAVEEILTVEVPIAGFKMNYILFKNKVVQYFNDDIGDANGLRSTLYQDIADEIFESHDGIYFCTEPGDETLKKPLGEWP